MRILEIAAIAVFLTGAPKTLNAQVQNDTARYRFELTAGPGPYPTIRGTTDMPDGTKLSVIVMKPHLPDGHQRMARGLPACEDMCGQAEIRQTPYVDPVVKNGTFIAGPFAFADQPVKPDIYPVRISVIPKIITDASLDAMNQPVYVSVIRLPGRAGP